MHSIIKSKLSKSIPQRVGEHVFKSNLFLKQSLNAANIHLLVVKCIPEAHR